jgi:hypothetical protein
MISFELEAKNLNRARRGRLLNETRSRKQNRMLFHTDKHDKEKKPKKKDPVVPVSQCYKFFINTVITPPDQPCSSEQQTDLCLNTKLDSNGNTVFGQSSCTTAPCFYIQCGGDAPNAESSESH